MITVSLSIFGQVSRSITTNLSDLRIEKVGEYDKVFIDKEFYAIDIVGHPELPVYIKSFASGKEISTKRIILTEKNLQT